MIVLPAAQYLSDPSYVRVNTEVHIPKFVPTSRTLLSLHSTVSHLVLLKDVRAYLSVAVQTVFRRSPLLKLCSKIIRRGRELSKQ